MSCGQLFAGPNFGQAERTTFLTPPSCHARGSSLDGEPRLELWHVEIFIHCLRRTNFEHSIITSPAPPQVVVHATGWVPHYVPLRLARLFRACRVPNSQQWLDCIGQYDIKLICFSMISLRDLSIKEILPDHQDIYLRMLVQQWRLCRGADGLVPNSVWGYWSAVRAWALSPLQKHALLSNRTCVPTAGICRRTSPSVGDPVEDRRYWFYNRIQFLKCMAIILPLLVYRRLFLLLFWPVVYQNLPSSFSINVPKHQKLRWYYPRLPCFQKIPFWNECDDCG